LDNLPPVLNRLLYSPFLVQLVVTRRCNLSCTYCNEFDEVSDPVPTAELKARMDKIRELGAWAVEFTGGEPMLHPEIYELTRYAKGLGFTKVMLISNAYLLNEEKVRKLSEAGLDDLQISIDGVTPNDVTVKVLKPLRKKLDAVIRAATFRVTLNAVIGSAPPEEALEVVSYAQEQGFRPRVCLIHSGDGQLKLPADQVAVYHEIKARLGKRFREAGDYRTRLMNEGSAPFRCRAGSRYLYVDEFGYVRWCSQQREAFGVPLDRYTPEDLRRQFHTRKGCSDHCTVGCVRTCSAYDEWRGQELEPDPALAAAALVQISPRPAPPPQAV
jgi:MoaA/NifB/PqqE/SkfB family radical SAM enzyme